MQDLLLRGDLVGALLLSFLADLALDFLALLPLLFLGKSHRIHRMLHRVTKERGKESGLKCCGLH